MKRLLTLLLLIASPVSAIDWHVYVSSDPSDGRNTHEVEISTNATRVKLEGSKVKACGVGDIKTGSLPPYFTFESRLLGCDLKDGTEIAIEATCLRNEDSFNITYLYLYNNKHLYELSIQCLESKPKEKQNEEAH